MRRRTTATASPTSTPSTRTTRIALPRSSSRRNGSARKASTPSSSSPSTTCATTRSTKPTCGPSSSRLKKIDGRAPVSIMTCRSMPDDPHLQTWLKEGLSLEVHTLDHPCPLSKTATSQSREGDRTTDASICWRDSEQQAGRVPHALLRFAEHAEPALLRRDLSTTPRRRKPPLHRSSVMTLITPGDEALPREIVLARRGRPVSGVLPETAAS